MQEEIAIIIWSKFKRSDPAKNFFKLEVEWNKIIQNNSKNHEVAKSTQWKRVIKLPQHWTNRWINSTK